MGSLLLILGYILAYSSWIYSLVLIARVILDWIRVLAPRWRPPSALLVLFDWVYRLTDPPVRWLRKFIPPVRLGNVALDVGFMILFIAVLLVGRAGAWLVYLGMVAG